MDGGLLPEDRVLWREKFRQQAVKPDCGVTVETLGCFFSPVKKNFMPNLLANWTILLAGDDGKVATDGPEAGEDLDEREDGELQARESLELSFDCDAGEKLIIRVQMFQKKVAL